ncbi:asparagine synthase (glutamine-hydrolyzing) [Legionella taurinensis]|uniref:asparagine synthase (glutamine-hydrolyzing) n=1 Tax=Legionella taurinensis TaxID=70611 RepID=A0A3A5LBW1_9GAMM|nr:asparagine synthase (glutamine-hydrolyzing) [Legionella taurinensis]MDX1838011.1 asparagine synthase (glutamine-hydrolyzing) [Legionella taurinensis]PUT39401.1 asparagine synthase (glutamine-hydrolyzing) [Legionella taurinensis]PUT41710.1 asparagine synthase (glutamine-hydrolyzing) [Legionella taurinensis]PUT44544.1 asparagine synthase (glutamine-hydrolyzing) [Legionella taurinensis]PUT46788.1 asparagine synthase (glutamine-hydrolyzing) [Legionella taurinensis]
MCGITGVLSLSAEPINVSKIKAMCDAIAHRGPDGAGYLLAHTGINHPRGQQYYQAFTEKKFINESGLIPCIDEPQAEHYVHQHPWNVFLGHRRLAILDLSSSGFQPICDLSKKIWLTYNGEIYNFKEIRNDLIKLGYQFYSNTDSEVVVNAYLEWGIECIHKFNGMFAFALWDRRQNKVFLARDRYGIKPLYYTRIAGNQFVFGSEIKAILAYLNDKPSLDFEGLYEYFTFQNFFTSKTLFNNITLLPPGHYLEISLDKDSNISQTEYWDFNFRESTEIKNENEYVEELLYLFEQAVHRQLVSDVEIGSFLSGGMDSGSITAIASRQLPYMKTFTVGFDLTHASGMELGFDERAKSELLSYIYKTEHYEMVLKSGDMERCLPKFAWHLEEPRVGQSYPNYYAAKLAGKFVKVVLSGAGGDELFGGYPWRYYRAVKNDNFTDYVDKYYQFWQRLVPNSELKQLFSPIWNDVSHVWTRDIFESVFKHHSEKLYNAEDYINHSLYFEAKTFLHGLLVIEDKLSMAHSLETRVPFLDNDLVDFAQKIPVSFKLNNLHEVLRVDENSLGDKAKKYYHKTNDGKLILRKALQKYMPQDYLTATKQGFSAPDNIWFKGDSLKLIQRNLLSEETMIYRYLDSKSVNHLVNQHLEGQVNRRLLIWSLLNFNEFIKTFLAESH